MADSAATRIDEISAEFADLAPRERLELLLEYANSLPPLSEEYRARRDAGESRVHECQTPVFLWADLTGGRVKLIADVAPEAPTVKGFVSVLAHALDGASVEEALAIDPNLVGRLGLVEALGMTRMRGLSAIVHAVRRAVFAASAARGD